MVVLIYGVACGGAAGTAGPATIPSGGFDLTSEDLQAALGSPPPDDITWQRTAGELTVVGRGTTPDPDEIDLIAAVARDVPGTLWDQVALRTVVRFADAPGTRVPHERPIAYALGPDIYLLDRAFALSSDGSSRYELARAFVHELVHVAQFYSMSDDYVAAALAGRTEAVDPTIGSVLVAEFADATGWQPAGDSPAEGWLLPDSVAASSPYGRTSAGEDMAEAVSLVAVGLPDLVPDDRVRWVERWLGVSADRLAQGRPWAPAGSVQVLSADRLYDEDRVAAAGFDRTHIEPLYFELPAGLADADTVASQITARLLGRGMSGSLTRINDDRLRRFGGAFAGPKGLTWWVELWDFRERPAGTTGPKNPVLTYVALW